MHDLIPLDRPLPGALTTQEISSAIGYAENAAAASTRIAYASDWAAWARLDHSGKIVAQAIDAELGTGFAAVPVQTQERAEWQLLDKFGRTLVCSLDAGNVVGCDRVIAELALGIIDQTTDGCSALQLGVGAYCNL
jgi:hypothetical protein